MTTDFVFSWAENEQGDMVHVDEVPRGIACGCKCPCCHERLLARHGGVKQHGFAHHSDTRRANLEICYMVSINWLSRLFKGLGVSIRLLIMEYIQRKLLNSTMCELIIALNDWINNQMSWRQLKMVSNI